MTVASVSCLHVPGLSFDMARISHPLGAYQAAIHAVDQNKWKQLVGSVTSQGGQYGVLSRNLRGEWQVRQRTSYEAVLDMVGHDKGFPETIGDAVVEKGGFVIFRWDPDPSYFKGGKKPVESVSWYEAKAFTLMAGGIYLLSDGEWEYAAENVDPLVGADGKKRVHCSVGSSETSTVDVDASGFHVQKNGLMHVIGNVWEWTEENQAEVWRYGLRGGSYYNFNPDYLRAAFRNNYHPDNRLKFIGLRVGAAAPQDSSS